MPCAPLGRVFGLFHEHQRPDARDHVRFTCKNLIDYDNTKEKNGWYQSLASASLSDLFAADFIPHSNNLSTPVNFNGDFDFESIMVSSSHHGIKDSTAKIFQKPTLQRVVADEN